MERAQHIADLQAHHGWRSLEAFVSEQADARRTQILSGGCVDIEEYRKHTGWLEGVLFVLNAADKIKPSAVVARGVLNKGA